MGKAPHFAKDRSRLRSRDGAYSRGRSNSCCHQPTQSEGTPALTRYHPTIAAALGLVALLQTPGFAAQDTPPPPHAARIDPAIGSPEANTATLEINFVQIANPKGQIKLALFDSKEAYESGAAPVRAIAVQVTGETVTATIPNVLHGRYGFKIVPDKNGDGAMNTNPFGMPIEPFAFSNNAVGNMGPATWEAAAFDIAEPTVQTITFR